MGGPDGRDLLGALPLLAGAGAHEVDSVAAAMHLEAAAPGQVLGREGEPGQVFWLLVEGEVAITTEVGHPDRGSAGEHPRVRVLAHAGAGSVIGELALLLSRPRTATVTALQACRYLCGGRDAMDRLLSIEPVRLRIRRLATRRLAEDARPVAVTLRDGSGVLLRPLLPSDREALDSALHALSTESLRRRFFSAGIPSERLVDYLIDIDYVDHFAWAALDRATHEGLGVARYIRKPGDPSGEVAFTTVDRVQGRGIGTLLLGALGIAATEAGLSELVALVLEDNAAMRRVLAKAGARTAFEEPGVLRLTVEPARAAALLDAATAAALAAGVHDVVTAASLALT